MARDDGPDGAPVADGRGGMLVEVGGGDEAGLARVALGLVRPVRIDGLVVDAGPGAVPATPFPSELDEGTALRDLFEGVGRAACGGRGESSVGGASLKNNKE